MALCLTIFLEAIQRFVEPQQVSQPVLILIVGSFGLAFNILGLLLLHDHNHGHEGHDHEKGAKNAMSTAEQGQSTEHGENTTASLNNTPNTENVVTKDVVGDTGNATEANPAAAGQADGLAHSLNKSDEITPIVARSPAQTRRRKTSSSSSARRGHVPRRSGSHTRYSSMGDVPVHLHPVSFRSGVIAASRLEEIDSAPNTESEDENEDPGNHHDKPSETQGLLKGGPKQNYGSEQDAGPTANKGSQNIGHTNHKHRQHKGAGKSHGHSHGDLNMRGIFLHVMGDALGNIGVIATALIIWLTDFSWRFYFDPAISIIITVIILHSAIPLCRAASRILLQAVQADISIDDITADIEDLPGVISCHHVHVWQLSDTKLIASLHVQLAFDFEGAGKREYMLLAMAVRTCLHEYGIHSSTIQPEFCLDDAHNHLHDDQTSRNGSHDGLNGSTATNSSSNGRGTPDACLLDCADSCGNATCCTPAPIAKP